ncbi:MAG: T9SS type A sorting domain-containing protein [Bacteroidia bacterium]
MKKVLLIISFFCIKQLNAQLCFTPADSFAVDTNTLWVNAADFNKDGKMDLVTANYLQGSLSILLGTGTGSFSPATIISDGETPNQVINADVNGDGNTDLITIGSVGNYQLSILLGTGTGSFGAPTTFGVPHNTTYLYPAAIVSGDFNGDSKPDLAMANNNTNNVSVLLNNGSGIFNLPVTILAADSGTSTIITADFNGDGKLDLVAANYFAHNISVYLGTGTGSFSAATYFPVAYQPGYLISNDFNQDGKLDIAIPNLGANTISILLGTGTGSFNPVNVLTVIGIHQTITAADFDGDGKIDLATDNLGSKNISVILGDGTGGFGAATDFFVGTHPDCILSADFNGDGKPDIAESKFKSKNVSVLLNCSITGIDTYSNKQDVFVYPNPTSDFFTIETNTLENQLIDLYDVNGRHVLNKTISGKTPVDVKNLDNGVYNLIIKNSSTIFNKKLVIVR